MSAPFMVVGLGASAGGLAALKRFFGGMPAEPGMAFAVVMHLSPEHESHAAGILQTVTRMPVTQVTEPVKVEPNRVYVIPPAKHLAMEDGMIVLSDPDGRRGVRAAIDHFFRTLAETHRERSVCVVLSGTGADGSVGIKRVKEAGGVALVQDPRDAEYDGMPRNAIATGVADFVLPVAEIPAKLLEVARNAERIRLRAGVETPVDESQAAEDPLRDVLGLVRSRTGHDFSHYKRATVLRRIERRMQVTTTADLPAYRDHLRENPQEAGRLLKDLLIGVTNFFRDPDSFEAFEREVVPGLFADKSVGDVVRVWCAGCATGEEAYSVAMLLLEHAERLPHAPAVQVFATDIDADAIAAAREGVYPAAIEADVPPARLRRFFVKEPGGYRIGKDVRERVLFAAHNLIKDPPFSQLDAAVCRNLLIYLDREAQEQVFRLFHFALRRGGRLFLGSSESTDAAAELFETLDKRHRLFRARPHASGARAPAALPLSVPAYDRPAAARPEGAAEHRRVALGELRRGLLEQYAPPSVVVNAEYEIVHLSEHAGRFLRLTGGEPSLNLLKAVLPELSLPLRTAFFQAMRTGKSTEATRVKLARDGRDVFINMVVRPADAGPDARFALVLFDEVEEAIGPEGKEAGEADGPNAIVRGLEDEARQLRRQLQTTVEQYETSVEELKASNEELQAINEELRSTTEELETSKEELQSVNEELRTVNHELKEKVDEVSAANDDLKNLMAATGIATVFLDRGLNVKWYTPGALELFRLLPTDAGRPLTDITHSLDYPDLPADAGSVLASLRAVEREVTARGGRAYLARLLPYRTVEDRIDGVVLTFIDVTELKRVEAALRASEETFRRAVEDAPIPVIMQAEDGEVLRVSRTWTELTGYSLPDVPTADAWLTRAYGPGADAVRHHMHELFQGSRKSLDVEFAIRTRGGADRHWSFSASAPGTLEDGRRFLVGMAVDVTDRERAEAALRESEERLRLALAAARMGVWTWDVGSDRQTRDENLNRMLGLDPAETTQPIEEFLGRVHPDDRDRVREAFEASVRRGRPLNVEFRVVRPDGSVRWLQDQGEVFPKAAGEPYMAGACVDVTGRREAGEALRASEERLRMIVETATDYAIFTFDGTRAVTSWNPGAAAVFGYSAEEMLGRSADELFVPEDRAAGVPDEEARKARAEGRAEDERWHVRKDGSRFYASGVTRPLDDGFLKVAQDLTGRKRAEDAVRRARDRLEDRVTERTAELVAANAARVELLRRLATAQEEERLRLSRELHDRVGQTLTGHILALGSHEARLPEGSPEREAAARLRSTADEVAREMHDVALRLRPTALTDVGLAGALRNYVESWSARAGIAADFHAGFAGRLPAEAETALYRVVQEALNNVLKHARATRVDVLLERRDGHVAAIVEDDGVGFDVEAVAEAARRRGRLGLLGMDERLDAVGGELEIESSPGGGTTVYARVPFTGGGSR